MSIKELSANRNRIVVEKLRDKKLREGLPFMINSNDLEKNQSYLEYPNGVIRLVCFVTASRNINVVKELSTKESINLRRRLNFSF